MPFWSYYRCLSGLCKTDVVRATKSSQCSRKHRQNWARGFGLDWAGKALVAISAKHELMRPRVSILIYKEYCFEEITNLISRYSNVGRCIGCEPAVGGCRQAESRVGPRVSRAAELVNPPGLCCEAKTALCVRCKVLRS